MGQRWTSLSDTYPTPPPAVLWKDLRECDPPGPFAYPQPIPTTCIKRGWEEETPACEDLPPRLALFGSAYD